MQRVVGCLLRMLQRAFLGGGIDDSEVPFIPQKLGFKEPSLIPTAQSCLLSTLLYPHDHSSGN